MPKPERKEDAPPAEGGPTGKDPEAKGVSTGAPDGEDDRLTYRVPEPPPEGGVTVDQRDGNFTYKPRLDESR